MPQPGNTDPATLPPARRREVRAGFGIFLIGITAIAWMPGPAGAMNLFDWDKFNHVAAFASLTVLARMGWPQLGRRTLALGLMVYGLVIEMGQAQPLVGRTASIADMVANGIGIAAGLGLAVLVARLRRAGRA